MMMLSKKELELIERVTVILGENAKYSNLVDIIERLVEVIENVRISE
jgi:hypothetical protein